MKAINAATLDYTKSRKQFGQPIAQFQVLQHRMADMFLHSEQATSMSYLAAIKCVDPDAERASSCAVGGEGRDRSGGTLRRPAGDPAARRHGHDR